MAGNGDWATDLKIAPWAGFGILVRMRYNSRFWILNPQDGPGLRFPRTAETTVGGSRQVWAA